MGTTTSGFPTHEHTTFNAGSVNYYEEQFRYIEQALAGQAAPLATAEDACRVDEVINAIFDAARREQ